MAGEREEIEMRPCKIDRTFQRTLGVADGIVIVQVTPVQLVPGGNRRRVQFAAMTKAGEKRRPDRCADELPPGERGRMRVGMTGRHDKTVTATRHMRELPSTFFENVTCIKPEAFYGERRVAASHV